MWGLQSGVESLCRILSLAFLGKLCSVKNRAGTDWPSCSAPPHTCPRGWQSLAREKESWTTYREGHTSTSLPRSGEHPITLHQPSSLSKGLASLRENTQWTLPHSQTSFASCKKEEGSPWVHSPFVPNQKKVRHAPPAIFLLPSTHNNHLYLKLKEMGFLFYFRPPHTYTLVSSLPSGSPSPHHSKWAQSTTTPSEAWLPSLGDSKACFHCNTQGLP